MRTTLFEVPGRSGKTPRPRVGFGFVRDPGGGPDRRSRSDVPSRFRRAAGFVDLGFERFVTINTDIKAWRGGRLSRQPGQSRRRAPRGRPGKLSYPPLTDWNAKRARARAPPGRKSDGHLLSKHRPHRPLWVEGRPRGKLATCPPPARTRRPPTGVPTLHWETQTAGLSLEVRHRRRHKRGLR